jgi:serine/threonine protein kinase
MTLAAGTKLGRYEIRSKLGEGGMGKVFGSQETKLGSQSCVEDSAIRTQVSRDRMERFISEAKSATAISLSAEQLLARDRMSNLTKLRVFTPSSR